MKRLLSIITTVIVSVSLIAGCASQKSPVSSDNKTKGTIKIGIATSLTGEKALTGKYTRNGVELAVEEINNKGGINGQKVEAVYEDDNGTDSGAVNAFNKLTGSDVAVIIGSIYSTMDLAISPSVKKAEIPTLVTGSSNDIAKQKNPWLFQSRTNDAISAAAIAKYAVNELKLKKIALIHDTDAYGQGAAGAAKAALEGLKVTPTLITTFNTGDKDFTPQLVKIKDSKADGILAFSLQTEAGLIMKQVKSLGLDIPFIGSTSFSSKIAIDLARENAENVYSVADYVPTTSLQKGQEFAKRYKEKYSLESDFTGAINYDAFLLAAEAIKIAKSTDKNAVKQALASINEFNGATNTFSFDENNVGGTRALVVQIKSGTPRVIESIKGR